VTDEEDSLAVGLLSIAGTTFAAGKSCDDVKADIDAKIKAKGVSSYTLEAVDKGSAADGKSRRHLRRRQQGNRLQTRLTQPIDK
jgi:hypothetical protein